MNKNAKKTLLERKFISIEYMTLYVEYFNQMVDSLIAGMNEFKRLKALNMSIDEHNFSAWIDKGYPILEGDRQYAIQALIKAKKGDASEISGSAGNLRGLSRDVDNIGGFGEWWKLINEKYWEDFWNAYDKADIAGNNIQKTYRKAWKNEQILKESITGVIDENELLNYLKPNETLADIS